MGHYELRFNKETEGKFRWICYVDGVAFKMYISQDCAPKVETIDVHIHTDGRSAMSIKANIKTEVRFYCEHTKTVHYLPLGDKKTWLIGEPYIPKAALLAPWPKQLHICVGWNSDDAS